MCKTKSCVISVSLIKGCYRHINIPMKASLENLSDAILFAFNFDNDHMHAFFMDNKAWSQADNYESAGAYLEEGTKYTCEYTLESLGLIKDKRFLYIFDFGDEWRFNCKVLREAECDSEEIVFLKCVGKAPVQYPSFEDEDERE